MTNVEKVKELYDKGLGVTEISLKIQMSTSNVCTYLNKAYGKDRPKFQRIIIVNKKYTLNDTYFEEVNSEDKAYFLGLLYADGCMAGKSNAVQIALQEDDRHILETFKEFIGSNKPLGLIKGSVIKGFKELKKDYIRKNQYIFVINSPKIKTQLLQLGITPKKSLTISFPNFLPKGLYIHFIRGYFDGNGGIYENLKNKWEISIASNESFCTSLQSKLLEFNINTNISKHSTLNTFYCRIHGKLNCVDFYNVIYNNATIYFHRKFQKFQKCINSTNTIRDGNSWKKETSVNS